MIKADRKGILLPKTIDLIDNVTINCPNVSLTSDYLICDITFVRGTDLTALIDYGDGTKSTFKTLGKIL